MGVLSNNGGGGPAVNEGREGRGKVGALVDDPPNRAGQGRRREESCPESRVGAGATKDVLDGGPWGFEVDVIYGGRAGGRGGRSDGGSGAARGVGVGVGRERKA